MTPAWLPIARSYLGVREFPGAQSNPVIVGFWKLARLAGIKDDAVPWCSGFACAVMERAGIVSPRSDSAKSWMTWGAPLVEPVVGCVAVFNRTGGFHVGFVVGRDAVSRNLLVLGGNQGDAVSIAQFPEHRVMAYRWPRDVPAGEPLPNLVAGAPISQSEA